jgi:hypothetical protein
MQRSCTNRINTAAAADTIAICSQLTTGHYLQKVCPVPGLLLLMQGECSCLQRCLLCSCCCFITCMTARSKET